MTISPEAMGILISRLDKDLAQNLVISAVSMNQEKFLKMAEMAVIVMAMRELEKHDKENAQKEAERLVEESMMKFQKRLETVVANNKQPPK